MLRIKKFPFIILFTIMLFTNPIHASTDSEADDENISKPELKIDPQSVNKKYFGNTGTSEIGGMGSYMVAINPYGGSNIQTLSLSPFFSYFIGNNFFLSPKFNYTAQWDSDESVANTSFGLNLGLLSPPGSTLRPYLSCGLGMLLFTIEEEIDYYGSQTYSNSDSRVFIEFILGIKAQPARSLIFTLAPTLTHYFEEDNKKGQNIFQVNIGLSYGIF